MLHSDSKPMAIQDDSRLSRRTTEKELPQTASIELKKKKRKAENLIDVSQEKMRDFAMR